MSDSSPVRQHFIVQRNIPSLDGLRAVSIGLVIFSHLEGTRHFLPVLPVVGDLGRLGVRIFFVISGFLITSLLLEERLKAGRISVGGFYFRRTVRIFPAAYAYIAIIALASAAGVVAVNRHDVVYAVTYTMNYQWYPGWNLGHLWSLAVEEQFYLLWAIAFAVLSLRYALWVAIAGILVGPVTRVGIFILVPQYREYIIGWAFPTVCDSLAVGCALALLRLVLERKSWYTALLRSSSSFGFPIALATATVITEWLWYVKHGTPVNLVVGETVMNVLIALWIHRVVTTPHDCVGQILNASSVRWVGRLSYSLYLWQEPFLNRHSSAFFASFPVNLVCMVVMAVISFYLVETPCLEWRARFERRWRQSRPILKILRA